MSVIKKTNVLIAAIVAAVLLLVSLATQQVFADVEAASSEAAAGVAEGNVDQGAVGAEGYSPSSLSGNWENVGGKWKFRGSDGIYPKATWAPIGNAWYYFNGDATMATGWLQLGTGWYYLGPDGAKRTGWQNVGGVWYLLDSNGLMKTGFADDGGAKYYLRSSGAMATGWESINGKWYYFYPSGAMKTGWLQAGPWYYLGSDGAMLTGWQSINGEKYFFYSSGAMVANQWVKQGNCWYFLKDSGAMAKGWLGLNGTWYYMNSDGIMQTGWLPLGTTWYYLHDSGAMTSGWKSIDGAWYYFHPSGAMAANCWVGNYWLQSNGIMATDAMVDNGKYYVDKNGLYVAPTNSTVDQNSAEHLVFALVNQERAKVGLDPLELNEACSKVAVKKSEDMVNNGYFDHPSPTLNGQYSDVWLDELGVSYWGFGENIAYGQKTPEAVMKAWMNSPGHRANILQKDYTDIGIGIAKNSKGVIYWTQIFMSR